MENDTHTNIGGFKKFIKTASRIVDKISVTAGGVVGFSTSFSQEHKLDTFKSAVLYWNSDSQEIGIEFSANEMEGIPKLRANNNGSGYTVNAKAFFAVNHIDTVKHRGSYPYKVIPFKEIDPSFVGEGKMYVINIMGSPAEDKPSAEQPTAPPAAPNPTSPATQPTPPPNIQSAALNPAPSNTVSTPLIPNSPPVGP